MPRGILIVIACCLAKKQMNFIQNHPCVSIHFSVLV